MSERGLLILLSGPSGSGKGTIRGELMKRDDRLRYSVSATTRPPRPGEKDAVDYFFISQEEFDRKMNEGAFLEYTNYLGNSYGTLWSAVDGLREKGYDVILEIETKGAGAVMKKVPDCVSLFILPPSIEELERRLKGRGTERAHELEKRIGNAQAEIEDSKAYQYIIENDSVERAAREILAIIHKRRQTQRKVRDAIDAISTD